MRDGEDIREEGGNERKSRSRQRCNIKNVVDQDRRQVLDRE